MGYLYVLQSEVNGRYYIGSTNNIVRRLFEHNSGKTPSLRNQLPMKLVFSKKYESLLEARRVELLLKKKKSRVILEAIVRDQLIKMGL